MTGITPAGDPRFGIAKELLVRLVRSVLREETEARETEARLWRLPESAAYYTFNATSHADRQALAPLVHELRAEVAGIIEALVEREPARTRLGHRLHEAACRCELRPWRSDDTAAYSALLDNERVWAMLPEPYPGPITRSMAADLIALSNGAPERHMVRAAIWRREPVGQVRLEFESVAGPSRLGRGELLARRALLGAWSGHGSGRADDGRRLRRSPWRAARFRPGRPRARRLGRRARESGLPRRGAVCLDRGEARPDTRRADAERVAFAIRDECGRPPRAAAGSPAVPDKCLPHLLDRAQRGRQHAGGGRVAAAFGAERLIS